MINHFEEHITKIKWVLPLVFFFGYFSTLKYFDSNSVEYLTYNLLAFVSCAVLLTQVKLFDQRYVAVWVALILLILLYFIRFYWITSSALPLRYVLPLNAYDTMVNDRNALLQAFKLSAIAFASFSFSSAALLFFMKKKDSHVHQYVDIGNSTFPGVIAKRALWAVTLLMLVLAYITYRYHIGEMGAPSGEALPFRLKGVVFYARTILIPLIILLSIYLAERSGHMVASRLGMLILVLHGLMDMFLRNSRSGLLLVLLLLVFLILTAVVKLQRKEKVFFAVMMVLAIIMIPIMSVYRNMRYLNLPHIEAFFNAVNIVSNDWVTQILFGLNFLLYRLPGIESLWCMIANNVEPLGLQGVDIINAKNGIAGYYTNLIYPQPLVVKTLYAPGFCGWFYLVAGLPAVVFGSLLAGVLSVLGWKFLDRRYLESGPIAQVFFLWMFFMALTEGTLDSMVYMFLVGLITIMAIEVGLRIFARKKPL